MKKLIKALFISMISCVAYAADYKGMSVGMEEGNVPRTLVGDMSRSGYYSGDYFNVTILDGKVLVVNIIYEGHKIKKKKKISLEEAIKIHSIPNEEDPIFGFAINSIGVIYGLVDVSNAIVYELKAPSSNGGLVNSVSYVSEFSPVVDSGKLNLVSSELADNLIKKSKLFSSSTDNSKENYSSIYLFDDRELLSEKVLSLSLVCLGAGEKTIALIDGAEIWLKINPKHPDAISNFEDLKKFNKNFKENLDELLQIYVANQKILNKKDLRLIQNVMSINKNIKNKMIVLNAMGLN